MEGMKMDIREAQDRIEAGAKWTYAANGEVRDGKVENMIDWMLLDEEPEIESE